MAKVITSLFGSTREQVEARAGVVTKPSNVEFFVYGYPGLKGLGVSYADMDYGHPGVDGKVLAVSVRFITPLPNSPDAWKEALRRAGFSIEGVVLGNDARFKSMFKKGYFKNVKGFPKGIIGYIDPEDDSLTFRHYSNMMIPTEWSNPK